MTSPLAQAGATVEPSEYSSLTMDEMFTGLWTNRNPLRDADVPYLYRKFYSASRFDSMLDGINREISARLTDVRRPGSSVYNDQTIPAIGRFYPYRSYVQGKETIRVIADCAGDPNQLLNPAFDSGATGWTLGTNWSVGVAGRPYGGNGNVAVWSGSGTGAITNNAHIACTSGQSIEATCWGLGEPSATGTATLQIKFWSNTNTLLATANSAAVANNYIWTFLDLTATAPASTSYATVDFNVAGSTGGPRWFAWQFTGSNAPIAATVRDVTGPHTNTILRTKSGNAGKTTFLGVGNILYGADGVNTWKLVGSSKSWNPNTVYQSGDYIIDSNQNIEKAIGAQTAKITNVQVTHGPAIISGLPTTGAFMTLYLSPTTPLQQLYVGMSFTVAGMTTYASGNGNQAVYSIQSQTQITMLIGPHSFYPDQALAAETGTVTSGTGATGATQPTWSTTTGTVTADGGMQWVNMGSAMQGWGGAGPSVAPSVTQVPAPTPAGYATWTHDTWYAPLFVILDSNGNLQQLTTAGTTGPSQPTWATAPGATTAETSPGTAVWTCKGPSAWATTTAYAVGAVIQATFTYSITVPVYTIISYNPYNNQPIYGYVQQTQNITVTDIFQCTVAGTSGTSTPKWVDGLGTTVTESTGVGWVNMGQAASWTGIGASQTLSLATSIIDGNRNVEKVQIFGKSGAGPAEPTWKTAQGAVTIDNSLSWLNTGPYAAANTGAWMWAYSGYNSITGEITNPSPVSQPLILNAGMQPVIQGNGLADTQFDKIILWRTAQNGSTLYYDDQFANPGAAQTWIYTDTNPDKLLNTSTAAPGYAGTPPTLGLTTPPPSTAVAPEFHCGRIWMIDGLNVIYSGGPDTLAGSGNSAFPPLNYFMLPEQPIKLKSITTSSGGLLVACVANTYIILGEGTASNPFLPPKMFMEGVGIQSYDGLCMRGSTLYGFSNKSKCFSMDPGNGEIEIGFPIGDQYKRVTTGGISAALYNPATAYVTWHEADSTDTGLYVSDGAVGWFRWSPIAPPESGSLWSPRAAIVPGTSAVQSVETSPGAFQLLIGPSSLGPILYRDSSVSGDWTGTGYSGYPSWDVKGSIGLCETGEVAEIAHVALKSLAVGKRPVVSLLLDEIAAGVSVEGRTSAWDVLNFDEGHQEDPPNLEPSITTFSDRYKTSSTPQCPKCENFQLRIDYGSQQIADELLKFGIYGATFKERRQQ